MFIPISRRILLALAFFVARPLLGQVPAITYNRPPTYFINTAISPLSPINSGGAVAIPGTTSTLAGSGGVGASVDGIGLNARFNSPLGIAVNSLGDVFVADAGGNVIRRITSGGQVTTVAGSGASGSANGTGTAASFSHPDGICTDGGGNIYIADLGNHLIRKISFTGAVTTFAGSGLPGFADGTGTAASFNFPTGVAADGAGNVYVADNGNNRVRKITPAGMVTTFAGSGAAGYTNGNGTSASFNGLFGIATDGAGNVYVADRNNRVIRKISSAGDVTTLAGNGSASSVNGSGPAASFNDPSSLTVDASGNVYVTEMGENNSMIRKITPAGVVSTLAGTGPAGWADGSGSNASFANPWAISADGAGNLYICDFSNNRIRKVKYGAYSISPQLPPGLTFDNITGVISGTPLIQIPSTAFVINAYNGNGKSPDALLNITVRMQGQPDPSNDQNYIISSVPRTAGLFTDDLLSLALVDKTKVETSVAYIDGLGRPLQNIQVKGSPTGRDMVQPIVYDQFGREAVKYLPYTAPANVSDGRYKTSANSDEQSFYSNPALWSAPAVVQMPLVNGSVPAYSMALFESSPLNRITEQGSPGGDWQPVTGSTAGHTSKTVYSSNNITALTDTANSLLVPLYTAMINTDQSRSLVAGNAFGSYYPAGQLQVTISRDENWKGGRGGTVEEYKDNLGHVVLRRTFNYIPAVTGVQATLQFLSTYYVYDDLGNLSFVLTPKSNADNGMPDQDILDNLCFLYRYDQRNRQTEKKLPGKGWEFTVYNNLDQATFTQDANQRNKANQEWTYIRYDVMGRVARTGIYLSGVAADGNLSHPSRVTEQFLANFANSQTPAWTSRDNSTATGYVTDALQGQTLTLNYYDDYSFPGTPYAPTAAGVSGNVKGLLTASQTAILNPDGTYGPMLWTVHYYDDLGREIQTYQQHNLGGAADYKSNNYDVTVNSYNFNNQITVATRQHNTAAGTVPLKVTIRNEYFYDHIGRKVQTWQQIQNAGQVPNTRTLISQNDYNEIGQLMTKKLQSTDATNFQQSVAYTYNERGWLLSSTAPLFAEQLYYNTGTNKQYNGNIAYQSWGTSGNLNNSYTYGYDQLNRLTAGLATTGNNENAISYDLNGNITGLNRYASGNLIDQLTYTYTGNGNQLHSVNDASGQDQGLQHGSATYGYDGNGNLVSDDSKKITGISYNMLNLPMAFTGKNTTYTYDAGGQKLRRVNGTSATDYISGIQYQDGVIAFIQTDEGRASPNGPAAYNYEYSLTDHLGNSRIGFDSATGAARLVQTDEYYPFGMDIIPLGSPRISPQNDYLYNKKELQGNLGLYDYGARFYDPVIARWTSVDPKSEIYQHWSPYNYVANNPIKNTDPDGTTIAKDGPQNITTKYVDPNGNEILNTNDGRNDVYVVPWDRRSEFEGNIALWQDQNSGVLNSQQWNNYWRGEFNQVLSDYQWNHFAFGYNSLSLQLKGEWIKQFITNDPADREKFRWDYVKSQWSDPVIVVGSLIALADAGIRPIPLTVDEIMENSNSLRGRSPENVEQQIGDTKNWKIEKLGKGSKKGQGWVLREYNGRGQSTGRVIRYHPGGGHHGPDPYWKVSNGSTTSGEIRP